MSDRRQRGILIGAFVVVLLPLALSALRLITARHIAINADDALIELKVRDIGSHTPLVGSYQRFGFNQPGPWLFYLLVLPYRFLGSHFAGLQVGAIVLHAGAILLIGRIAYRRGGVLPTMWTLFLLSILLFGMGPRAFSDPWEPNVVILATVLLLMLSWDLALGNLWAAPVMVGVGSLIATAYLAVAGIATALMLAGVVMALVGLVRVGHEQGATLRARFAPAVGPAVAAAAVGIVISLAPILDQLRERPGNLRQTLSFLTERHVTLGVGPALRAVALEFGHRAPWLGNHIPLEGFSSTVDVDAAPIVPLALLAVVAVLVSGWRRRSALLVTLTMLALVTVAANVVALSRLVGPLYSWSLIPGLAVGFACWLPVGWWAWVRAETSGNTRFARWCVPLLLVAMALPVVANSRRALDYHFTPETDVSAVTELANRAVPSLRTEHKPILVTSRVSATNGLVFGARDFGREALVLALNRAGIDAVVVDDGDSANRFGSFRAHPERAERELRIVDADEPVPVGFRRLATFDALTSRQRELIREFPRYDATKSSDDFATALRKLEARLRAHPELRARLAEREKVPDLPVLSLILGPNSTGA